MDSASPDQLLPTNLILPTNLNIMSPFCYSSNTTGAVDSIYLNFSKAFDKRDQWHTLIHLINGGPVSNFGQKSPQIPFIMTHPFYEIWKNDF